MIEELKYNWSSWENHEMKNKIKGEERNAGNYFFCDTKSEMRRLSYWIFDHHTHWGIIFYFYPPMNLNHHILE